MGVQRIPQIRRSLLSLHKATDLKSRIREQNQSAKQKRKVKAEFNWSESEAKMERARDKTDIHETQDQQKRHTGRRLNRVGERFVNYKERVEDLKSQNHSSEGEQNNVSL